MSRNFHAMEPLLLFCLPVLLLFAVQGSEFSVLSGWLTVAGLLAPIVLRPGSRPKLALRQVWSAAACISRLLLFLQLRTHGWDELSTWQGALIAVAGLSGALAAAGSKVPSWTTRSVFWVLFLGAPIAFVFPYVPSLPLAIGGLVWLEALSGSTAMAVEKSVEAASAVLGSWLLGVAIGFPVVDGSLMGAPATSTLGFALLVAAAMIWWSRLSDLAWLDLLPPLLVGLVVLYPATTLTPIWPIAAGIGIARILVRPHAAGAVMPAASFVLGVALAHALVSQALTVYLVGALALAELLRIFLDHRATRRSRLETGRVVDTPGIDLLEE